MAAARPNRVRPAREARSLTQLELATAASISRQALSAIEAGRAEPSVSLALRLARVLECPVEELFEREEEGVQLEVELAEPQPRAARPPERVALAFVRERWVAHALSAREPETATLAADALPLGPAQGRKGELRLNTLRPLSEAKATIVLVGCAPALGLLAQRLNGRPGPGRFVWLKRTSGAALDALGSGTAHVAGVHLAEGTDALTNVPAVRRRLPGARLSMITLAQWEAGLLLRPHNPLGVRQVSDLARRDLRIATRQAGAGARQLLERRLRAARLQSKRVLEGALELHGHLEVAQAVSLGAADVGVAMEHAALAYGLDFVPLASERFDLVLPDGASEDPRIARMLDVMNGRAFRRELAALGGYDGSDCGRAVASL